eukprot:g269.t1
MSSVSSFYVGNYSITMGHVDGKGKGIQKISLDEKTGELMVGGTYQDAGINPTYLCYDNGILFVVNETESGMVKSFIVNHEDGSLKLVSNMSSKGADPCYCEVFYAEILRCKLLLVANYSSGSTIIFKISEDGSLEEFAFYQHVMQNQGPNKNRQEAPHAHMARSFGDGKNLQIVVPDLGLDKVLQFSIQQLDEENTDSKKTMTLNTTLDMKLGDGPRHLEFHPNKSYAYVVSELSCTVTVVSMNYAESSFGNETCQIISTLPFNYDNSNGGNTCAHIQIHPSGKFLYVSNRGGKDGGHHSVVVFSVNDTGDKIALESSTYFENGKTPRAFSISPSGKYLVVAWQDSDYLTSYEINLNGNGELLFKHSLECLTPVVLAWIT